MSAPSVSALQPSVPLSLKLGARAASACATRASAAVTWNSAARTSGRCRSVSAGMASTRSSEACGTGMTGASDAAKLAGGCPVNTASA